jgi:hypothetical protein
MHRFLGFSAIVLLVVGLVVFLAACGGASPATTSTSAASATSLPPETTASTSTTAAAPSTATSAAKGGELGTKDNPIPIGKQATVGDWKINVVSADLNADAELKDAAAYQPPDPGNQYVIVVVDATYGGELPDSFSNGLGYQIVGKSGDTFDSTEVGLDNSIANSNAQITNGSVSGPVVFQVPSTQVDGAMLWMAPASAQTETGIYFALQ